MAAGEGENEKNMQMSVSVVSEDQNQEDPHRTYDRTLYRRIRDNDCRDFIFWILTEGEMTDYELMTKKSHKEEFKRWKETQAFLYGQSYAEKFCTLETFKKHLRAMGFMENS